MAGRKPDTRKSTAKSGKKLKLNKRTLKDLAPAKDHAVRGGFAITKTIEGIAKTVLGAIPP